MDNRPWSEIYAEAGDDWADKEAAASLLEDCKSAYMAELCIGQGDIPVNRAEMNVKASRKWREYIENMVEARKQANKARVYLESIKMRAMEQHSKEATFRAEARL